MVLKKTIQILQWNARSAIANKHSLNKCLSDNDIDIALISESWFQPGRHIGFSGYNLVRSDRLDGRTGVAILVKTGICFRETLTNSDFIEGFQICGIEMQLKKHYFIKFYSFYCEPTCHTRKDDWKKLFDHIGCNSVLGGDFNSHHTTWGSYKIDQKGKQILEVLEDYPDLVILNNGESTRLDFRNPNSAIDLTLTNPNLHLRSEWNTIRDTLGSDHFPILLKISLDVENQKTEWIYPTIKWNTNYADWDLYTTAATQFFTNITYEENLDKKYDLFLEGIQFAAQETIPQKKTH